MLLVDNSVPLTMTWSKLGIAAAVCGGMVIGYCIYFDRKRRIDPDFKKKLRERRRARSQAEKAAKCAKKAQFPDFRDHNAVQAFFLQQIQLGEELLGQGKIDECVEHIANAVSVCGQPQQLLNVLQQTLPPQVFSLLIERLPSTGQDNVYLNPDIFMQLFSPLITSQRIMINHFSNAYSSISCFDGLNFMFSEYIGYLFVVIGYDRKDWLKRLLTVFVSIIKHVCGPNVSTLKSSEKIFKLVCGMVDTWYRLVNTEQSVLVEAIEQLRVDNNVATSCIKALTEATDKLKSSLTYSQIHALILVNHRFLSLYSTRTASELLPCDIMFLSLVGEVVEQNVFQKERNCFSFMSVYSDSENSEDEPDECFYSPDDSKGSDNVSVKSCIPAQTEITESSLSDNEFSSNFIFLLGKRKPHAVHVSHIVSGIPVFLIYEVGNEHLNSCILDGLLSLCGLEDIQVRGTTDREVIHSAVDSTDNAMRKLNDAFKKKNIPSSLSKLHSNTIKSIVKKWEPIKKKYQDYLKSHNTDLLQKMDSTIENIVSLLRNMYSNCVMDNAVASVNHDTVLLILHHKSTLSINKYLEEFPGLVHFLYIDRITHRFVAPHLDFSSQETTNLTKKKIWNMIQFARIHLQEGCTSIMWKDTLFHYSYFLWFEDSSGTPIKPKVPVATVIKTLSAPSVLTDFYSQLLKKCFLVSSNNRIRCYELFSVHLGLVTASCVLEQCRRLTATIWEVTGVPTSPLDLL
ncbi:hypothetical protein PGB90_000667 [Kerria lacca]